MAKTPTLIRLEPATIATLRLLAGSSQSEKVERLLWHTKQMRDAAKEAGIEKPAIEDGRGKHWKRKREGK